METLPAAPTGATMPRDTLAATNEPISNIAYRQLLVTFDNGETVWRAIRNAGYWNGFLCPVFDEDTAHDIARYVRHTTPIDDDETTPIKTPMGEWLIGFGSWCWTEWSEN